jgi:flagellar basal-body rod protein FlgB
MLQDLTITKLASAMSRHAAARHAVIAGNVANADTPGYRARDVKDFAEVVKEPLTIRATRPGHRGSDPVTASRRPEIVDAGFAASPNGNSVNLEDQAIRAVEAQGQHRLALAVYSKTVDILRIGLGRGR